MSRLEFNFPLPQKRKTELLARITQELIRAGWGPRDAAAKAYKEVVYLGMWKKAVK